MPPGESVTAEKSLHFLLIKAFQKDIPEVRYFTSTKKSKTFLFFWIHQNKEKESSSKRLDNYC